MSTVILYSPAFIGAVVSPLYFIVIFPSPTIPGFAFTIIGLSSPLYILLAGRLYANSAFVGTFLVILYVPSITVTV